MKVSFNPCHKSLYFWICSPICGPIPARASCKRSKRWIVAYCFKVQSVCRSSWTRPAAIVAGKNCRPLLKRNSFSSNQQHRADNIADHMLQKSICPQMNHEQRSFEQPDRLKLCDGAFPYC